MIPARASVQASLTPSPSGRTMSTADISSRCSRVRCSGIGVSQMSASRPIWCEAWPVIMGPPRGCEISPTRMPGHIPASAAFLEKRSRNAMVSGLPQLRLRETRMTRQLSPSSGNGLRAREAAPRVEADGAALRFGRRQLAAEHLLGGVVGIFGMGERRQRLGVHRPGVLRRGRSGEGAKREGGEGSGTAHGAESSATCVNRGLTLATRPRTGAGRGTAPRRWARRDRRGRFPRDRR